MFGRRRFRYLSAFGFLLAMLLSALQADAQVTQQIGGFNVQFWDPADGAAYIPGGTIPANELSLFTPAEIDAITRALNYWTDVLNLTAADAESPVIRIVNWTAPPFPNAFAAPVVTGGELNTITRLQGGMPARDMGLDGGVAFLPDGLGFETDPITQFPNGSFNMEMVAIHEIGHLLGVALTVHDPFNALVVGNTFVGANAMSVYGGGGIPLAGDGGHTAIPYENITRGLVLGQDFRNIPHASPAELAILADLGFGVVLSDNFGRAYYQDGVMTSDASNYSPGNDFGIGLYLLADNLDITQNGNLTASGYAGTGIRIVGEFNNEVTVGTSSTVTANGLNGIGILASGGANHDIVVRGDVSATGTNGVGIWLDFGDPFIFSSNFIDSTSYNAPLVDTLDISAAVSGESTAIFIADTAGLNELNIMNGAAINGDIVNNAIVAPGFNLNRPLITFGRLADGSGQATGSADPAFNFTFNDDIVGITRFDADFVAGTTNLNGVSLFNDSDIQSGATLGTTGTVITNTLDVMSGATLVSNGLVSVFNTLTVAQNSRIEGNGTINSGNVPTINGTIAPGNSIGTLNFGNSQIYSPMSVLEIEVQPSAAPVPGTDNDLINVNGNATFDGGVVNVLGLPPNGAYTAGASYTYLQTTDGVIVNTDPTFQENLVGFRLIPFYTLLDAGFLLAFDGGFAQRAGTFNQRAVGRYLDVVILDEMNANIQALRDNLDLLELNELRNALDQLSGELYGSASLMQIQSANQMFNLLSNQVNHNQLCYPHCHNEFWYAGYAFGGDADDDGNAHDTHYDVVGALLGQSHCIAPQTIGGVYYNYEDQNLHATDVRSNVSGYSHRLGAYARNQAGPVHTLASGFLGWLDMESQRNVRINTISETNRADYDGFQTGLYYENGLTYTRGLVTTQPFFSLQYLHWKTNGFTETGGALTALDVDSFDVDSFRTQLGGRVSAFTLWNYVEVELEGAWIHEAADTVADYSAALVSAQNARYVARGLDLGSDFFNIGPSMLFRYGNTNLFAEYQAYIGEQGTLHTGQWGAEFVW